MDTCLIRLIYLWFWLLKKNKMLPPLNTKKLTIPLKDYSKSSKKKKEKKHVPNPVGLQHVNHVLNILAHLASRREINDMSNLYNNPPKMKELSNKSTCATTLI